MKSIKTNRESGKPNSSWGLMSKSSSTNSGTTPNGPRWSRAKSKCWRSCKKVYKFVFQQRYLNLAYFFSPELKPVEKEAEVQLRFPEVEPIAPPAIQLDEVCFSYSPAKTVLNKVNLSAGSDSRICIVTSHLMSDCLAQVNIRLFSSIRSERTEPVRRLCLKSWRASSIRRLGWDIAAVTWRSVTSANITWTSWTSQSVRSS